MTFAAGLIVSRFAHYLAASVLFGAALFPFYGFARKTADGHAETAILRPLLLASAWLLPLSGVPWFLSDIGGSVGAMTGSAGLLWTFRFILSAVLLIRLHTGRRAEQGDLASILSALVLLATLAWTANPDDAYGAAAPVRAFHLAAAGVWTGALFVFMHMALRSARHPNEDDLQSLHDSLAHFSGAGTAIVAVLLLTGVFLFGRPNTSGAYFIVLVAKLAMFAAMLLLAAANRFWLTPRLSSAIAARGGLKEAIGALRISLTIETALGISVLAAVAWLKDL